MKKLIKISTSIILVLLIALNGMAVFALSSESTTSGSTTTDSGLPLADYSLVNKYYGVIFITDPGYPRPTSSSWSRYYLAKRQVVFNLDITHQAEVDTMAANLMMAFNSLEFIADYGLLSNALYNKLPRDLSIYTLNTAQVVMDAAEIAQNMMQYNGTNVKSQSEVNKAASTLSSAIMNLERVADKKQLTDAIQQVPSDLSFYMEDSFNNLNDLIENADDILLMIHNREYGVSQQTTVNQLAQDIISAINALVLKKTELEPLPSSLTVVDKQHKWIYGLSEGIKNLDQFVDATDGKMNCHPTEHGFGTGTKVDFVVNNKVVNTYAIVIFGDVNGDGVIDAFDQSNLTAVTNFESGFDADSPYQSAGDVNNDGVIDPFDLAVMTSAINFETIIDQRGALN